MSRFVNYKKRDVTLPKGCKDLADLLKEPSKRLSVHYPELASPAPAQENLELLNSSETTAGLEELGKYIDLGFNSVAAQFGVTMASGGDDVGITFFRLDASSISGTVSFRHTPEREKVMRELFARHGLEQPQRDPRDFAFKKIPGVSIYGCYSIQPFPVESERFREIAEQIIRELLGGGDLRLLYMFREYRWK